MTHATIRTVPLQNKVDPWGELQAVRARGTLMGNRGILHDGDDHIVRRWAHKNWVFCSLHVDFQKRSPFTQGTYSELFFLDEATAYAAGHRPCRVCQREKHHDFNTHWTAANRPDHVATTGQTRLPISQIDAVLHTERVTAQKTKRTHVAHLAGLPVGTLFTDGGQALLVGPAGLWAWSFDGYRAAAPLPPETQVELLTPPSVVAAMRHGLRVDCHPSVTM